MSTTVNSALPNGNNDKLRKNLTAFINNFNKRNNLTRATKLNINNKLATNLKTWIGKKRPYVAAAAAQGALLAGGTQAEANKLGVNAGNAASPAATPQTVGLAVSQTPGVSKNVAAGAGAAAAAETARQNGTNASNAALTTAVTTALGNASSKTSPVVVGNNAQRAAAAGGATLPAQKAANNVARLAQVTRKPLPPLPGTPAGALQVENLLKRAGNKSTNKAVLISNIKMLLNRRNSVINPANRNRLVKAKALLEKNPSLLNRVFGRITNPKNK